MRERGEEKREREREMERERERERDLKFDFLHQVKEKKKLIIVAAHG